MIIPEMGQWVCCLNRLDPIGKVVFICFDRNECLILFLLQSCASGRGSEEVLVGFKDIGRVIDDKRAISCFEEGLEN